MGNRWGIPDGEPHRWLDEVAIHWTADECLIFPYGKTKCGQYGQVRINGKMGRAHRYVCAAVHGPAPFPKAEVAHRKLDGSACEQPACCAPLHLRWADGSDNQADRLLHGTDQLGEKNPSAKLTTNAVLEIRTSTATYRELAQRFGISEKYIWQVKAGRSWSHLKRENSNVV